MSFVVPMIYPKSFPIMLLFLLVYSSTFGQGENSLFKTDEILQITLSGNMHQVMRDRSGNAVYQPVTVRYNLGPEVITVPARVKTRGHFRLTSGNCQYPPLLLNFSDSPSKSGHFSGLHKLKLVTPCRGERFVIHEYLVYKLYNIVTDRSLQARLVKVAFEDSVKKKNVDPVFGILLEEDVQMAKRHSANLLESKPIKPEETKLEDFLKMAVFEYMIGNTDWSVQYQQNVKLISFDSVSSPCTVAYDFDHAGIVRATYAKPAPELDLGSTLIRRYRGYCMPSMSEFQPVIDHFNAIREQLYDVYRKCELIESSYKRATLKYLDDFYDTINSPQRCKSEFMYPCDKSGTGNVVIRGMKKG